MPKYDYVCRSCGAKDEKAFLTEPYPCPCGGLKKRHFGFQVGRSFTPHFNHSVGRYVSNERQFKDALSQASDHASETTGTEHRYVPMPLGDAPSAQNVTQEGMDETNKRKRDGGWVEPGKKIFY